MGPKLKYRPRARYEKGTKTYVSYSKLHEGEKHWTPSLGATVTRDFWGFILLLSYMLYLGYICDKDTRF
jgi:hypothetical protein